MHKYIALFFSVSLFLFSCKGGKAPEGVIDHKQMTALLAEVHLVDGRLYGVFQSQDSLAKYGTMRYDALFRRYHTDSATFKKSLRYYASQPVELQKMYDDILANFKIKTDSLNKLERKTDSLNRLQLQNKTKPKVE